MPDEIGVALQTLSDVKPVGKPDLSNVVPGPFSNKPEMVNQWSGGVDQFGKPVIHSGPLNPNNLIKPFSAPTVPSPVEQAIPNPVVSPESFGSNGSHGADGLNGNAGITSFALDANGNESKGAVGNSLGLVGGGKNSDRGDVGMWEQKIGLESAVPGLTTEAGKPESDFKTRFRGYQIGATNFGREAIKAGKKHWREVVLVPTIGGALTFPGGSVAIPVENPASYNTTFAWEQSLGELTDRSVMGEFYAVLAQDLDPKLFEEVAGRQAADELGEFQWGARNDRQDSGKPIAPDNPGLNKAVSLIVNSFGGERMRKLYDGYVAGYRKKDPNALGEGVVKPADKMSGDLEDHQIRAGADKPDINELFKALQTVESVFTQVDNLTGKGM